MSFDIFVQDILDDAKRVEDIPDDFRPQAIGRRSSLVAAIMRVAPEMNFAIPAWGTIDADDYSVEVNIGLDDPVMGFAFHVRGGERGQFLVAEILAELGARAFAPGTESGFFEVDRGARAFLRWRSLRDRLAKP